MIESVKRDLISEIEDLQTSLTHLIERVKDDRLLGRVKAIDANRINVLIGCYDTLTKDVNHDSER